LHAFCALVAQRGQVDLSTDQPDSMCLRIASTADDMDAAERLWRESEKITAGVAIH
jgi:hypothetical protein